MKEELQENLPPPVATGLAMGQGGFKFRRTFRYLQVTDQKK